MIQDRKTYATGPLRDWLADYAANSEHVKQFCEEHGLALSVNRMVGLVKENYPDHCRITLSVESDPDSDEEWLEVGIEGSGTPEDFLRRYNRCIALWVSNKLPDSNPIRLNVTLID